MPPKVFSVRPVFILRPQLHRVEICMPLVLKKIFKDGPTAGESWSKLLSVRATGVLRAVFSKNLLTGKKSPGFPAFVFQMCEC